MSIVKDINELHISVKAILISIAAIMPFWFIDIFLFHNFFYISYPFYITVIFSYCFALIFYIPYIAAGIYNLLSNMATGKSLKHFEMTLFFYPTLFYIIVQSCLTLVAYIFKFNFNTFLIVNGIATLAVVGLFMRYFLVKLGKVSMEELDKNLSKIKPTQTNPSQ